VKLVTFSFALFCVLSSGPFSAREPKENDKDVNYDEEKLPAYDLPPLLTASNGQTINTPEDWFRIRRPEIMSLFGNLVYGTVPKFPSPFVVSDLIKKQDSEFLNGMGTRQEIGLRFRSNRDEVNMHLLVFTPNDAKGPVPAFMIHSFDNTRSNKFDADRFRKGRLNNGWPIEEFFKRGYGLVVVYQQDLIGHNEIEFQNGIHKMSYPKGQSFPKASQWGVLSTIAWGGSQAMSYLENSQESIDPKRVALMGHSKLGKAALWNAAQDQRFALAISAQSGCAGAALWRRKSGETLEKMVTRFPYWLCRNAWKFVNNEDDLPVDQHMLLACIAPRPVYVHSADDDTWADGRGEYLSAYHAGPVYKLLGKKGLESEESPPVGEAIINSDVGYHIREGGHSIEMFDWLKFLDFADHHLK